MFRYEPGDMFVTFHATDMAGDVTTTNLTYTLDYSGKTNPPPFSIGRRMAIRVSGRRVYTAPVRWMISWRASRPKSWIPAATPTPSKVW